MYSALEGMTGGGGTQKRTIEYVNKEEKKEDKVQEYGRSYSAIYEVL